MRAFVFPHHNFLSADQALKPPWPPPLFGHAKDPEQLAMRNCLIWRAGDVYERSCVQ